MSMNKYSYQREKIGQAVSGLMGTTDRSLDEALILAMPRFREAFPDSAQATVPPSEGARPHYDKIKEIMGDGPAPERLRGLTPQERDTLVSSFWELYCAVTHDYCTVP